jgi:hypothetical protein
MSENKKYKCSFCIKEYESNMSLWRHKKNKHNNENDVEIIPPSNIIINNQTCKYCYKQFYNTKNRWRHEKLNCKIFKKLEMKKNQHNSEITNITNNNIQTQNNNINTQNNIQTQNNNNNININNTINISLNALGCEDVSILNQDEIEQVINKGLVNIVKLVELLNFHEDRPQNHTYCTTNLNNKYLSAVNTETNEIEMKSKNDIFDKVIRYALNHCDMLKEYITDKNKKSVFTDRIADLENKLPIDLRKNKYYDELNILSYNKRKLIQQTWSDKLKLLNI